nr:glycine betaine ABC transporter substrate-binding protein [Mycobacterium lepromatosis]
MRQKYSLDISPSNLAVPNDYGGAVTVHTPLERRVTAANIFITSQAIPQSHLVELDDPKHHVLASNIVPLVNSQKKPDRIKDVLDTVFIWLGHCRIWCT